MIELIILLIANIIAWGLIALVHNNKFINYISGNKSIEVIK